MRKTILMLALFPFFHSTAYQVEYVSCKIDEILVKHEDETIHITLFNTKMIDDKGWVETCKIIKDAKQLRIEIDPASKIEEAIPVYLFADHKLVQEELMKKSYAYPMIRNPEYTYEERLEEALYTTQTIANPTKTDTNVGYPIVAPLSLGIVVFIWVLMFGYMILKHKKKQQKTNKKEM